LQVWQYPDSKQWDIEYVCGKIEYQLSGENIPITEFWEYKILIRPDKNKEIAYKQCILKRKNGKDIDGKSCPILNRKCLDSEPKLSN
jgi:hypothetical protein